MMTTTRGGIVRFDRLCAVLMDAHGRYRGRYRLLSIARYQLLDMFHSLNAGSSMLWS